MFYVDFSWVYFKCNIPDDTQSLSQSVFQTICNDMNVNNINNITANLNKKKKIILKNTSKTFPWMPHSTTVALQHSKDKKNFNSILLVGNNNNNNIVIKKYKKKTYWCFMQNWSSVYIFFFNFFSLQPDKFYYLSECVVVYEPRA